MDEGKRLALEKRAKEIVLTYLKRKPETMTRPSTIACGATYLASKLLGVSLTQAAIEYACFGKSTFNNSSLRKAYKDIDETLKLI